MDQTYRTVNALIDDLRLVDAPPIPKLRVEIQLIKIKHMLLIIEAEQDISSSVKALLARLKSTYDSYSLDPERLLPFITEIAEEMAKIAHKEGTHADRRIGVGGSRLMRRKEDHL